MEIKRIGDMSFVCDGMFCHQIPPWWMLAVIAGAVAVYFVLRLLGRGDER